MLGRSASEITNKKMQELSIAKTVLSPSDRLPQAAGQHKTSGIELPAAEVLRGGLRTPTQPGPGHPLRAALG